MTTHPLVDVATVQQHLEDPQWLVVDIRHDLADPGYGDRAYTGGHVPGAYFLHLDRDLSGPRHSADGRFRGRHPLPEREAFADRLARVGVAPHTMLVAYDDADAMYAARLWWLARWIGHAQVAVLDGGLRAWREAGYALSTTPPSPRTPRTLPPRPPLVETVTADELAGDLASGRWRIVDARAAERYRGDVEPLDAKAGHIPGARNRPFRLNVHDDGRFRSPDELRLGFADTLGDTPPDQVVHQCGSGVTACHNLLAMTVAGMPGARLYPGSWSEWSADPARPVATGATP
ncbi:MAG: sulfurtransferase [Casimicrobiaceae bacterium]